MPKSNVVRLSRTSNSSEVCRLPLFQRASAHQKEFQDAMLAEVTSTALLAAVTTGLLNSRIAAGSIPFDVAMRFLPANPTIFAAARLVLRDDRASAILDCVGAYYDDLEAAKLELLRSRQCSGAGYVVSVSERWELVSLWRAACATGARALIEIGWLQKGDGTSGAGEHVNLILDALISARDGRTPYLENGLPVLPEWAERRLAKRFILNAPATLNLGHRKTKVMVTDASRRGIGLDQAAGLKVGDVVSIELFGRKFIATVVWTAGLRAGVTLRKSLSAFDPLLSS